MSSPDMLGKIVIALTAIPQHWGLVLDVIEKMTKPKFARELAKFARRETCWLPTSIISIGRGYFNPAKFMGLGWSIVEDETDTRSIALTVLDLIKVQHVTMLKDDETYIRGEENLERLKSSDYIRLDADIFFTLWENRHLIPEWWKERISGGNIRYILFDGTILRSPDGNRYVMYLYWGAGQWEWSLKWLGHDSHPNNPSAVLAA